MRSLSRTDAGPDHVPTPISMLAKRTVSSPQRDWSSPALTTGMGLKVIVIEERLPGDNVTAENESSAEISFPISRMKGEVVIAGVGFVIDVSPIMISEIGESDEMELVMIILLLGTSTTQPNPVTKLKLYAM